MKIELSFVFDRKKKVKTKIDLGLIELRYYQNPTAKYYSTKIAVRYEQWDNLKERIIKHDKEHSLNDELDKLKEKINKARRQAEINNESFNVVDVKQLLQRQRISTVYFNVFALNQINNDNSLKEVTKRSKRNSLNKLILSNGGKNILFSELNYNLCYDFKNYLEGITKESSEVYKHYKNIKSLINHAIKQGYYKQTNPFKDIKVKVFEKPVTALNEQQLQAIENLKFEPHEQRLNTIRDMFLFSCYTCLRISDLLKLNKNQLEQTKEGLILKYTAVKTNKPGIINLFALFPIIGTNTTKPIEIINKYLNQEKDLIFKKYSDQVFNRELKIIGHRANINFNLTAHIGRKTFGTSLPAKGISTFALQQMMQHSSIKTTQRYVDTSNLRVKAELINAKWE